MLFWRKRKFSNIINRMGISVDAALKIAEGISGINKYSLTIKTFAIVDIASELAKAGEIEKALDVIRRLLTTNTRIQRLLHQ